MPLGAGSKLHGLVLEKVNHLGWVQVQRDLFLKIFHSGVALNAGGMGEQMLDGDGVSVRRVVGNKLGDVVLKAEFALFHQLQNGNSSELLGDGSDTEDVVHLHGNVEFEVGHSKCFVVDYLSFSGNQGSSSGFSWFEIFGQ